ncbi:MAG TPA: hypothetical protein VFQ39_05130 [Longimicrobium sp.]|nr:hypothetical protein [Longimicrobium sp.]
MQDLIARIGEDLVLRLHGPLTFRFVFQPAMAVILAVRAGLADARAERPAYLWAVLTNREHRREIVRGGWQDVAKIFLLAVVLDVIYQLIAFHRLYPLEVLIVAFILAVVPYSLVRGPVNRIARWVGRRR